MVLHATPSRSTGVRRERPPASPLLVGDDVLHVLECGTMEAAGAAVAEWRYLVATCEHQEFYDPPLGCNCGRVANRSAPSLIPPTPPSVALALPRRMDERLVYFIHAPAAMLIKIGISNDVERRRRDLERNAPGESSLVLLATERGGFARERALHERFADERERGEWFTPSTRLLAYIEGLA